MSKLMLNGVPTDAEVTRLREAFPITEMEVGQFFPYEQLEAVTGEKRGGTRFRNILLRWKKIIEKETLHYLGCVKGIGYKLCNDNEKADAVRSFNDQGRRKLFRGMKILPKIDRSGLTDENKAIVNRLELSMGQSRALSQIKRIAEHPKM